MLQALFWLISYLNYSWRPLAGSRSSSPFKFVMSQAVSYLSLRKNQRAFLDWWYRRPPHRHYWSPYGSRKSRQRANERCKQDEVTPIQSTCAQRGVCAPSISNWSADNSFREAAETRKGTLMVKLLVRVMYCGASHRRHSSGVPRILVRGGEASIKNYSKKFLIYIKFP